MKIDVLFSLSEAGQYGFARKTAVVIDVLRATSSAVTALAEGAKEIIPAASIPEAVKIKKRTKASLLCGEREGRKIKGFDLGNSPMEFLAERVRGRTLVMATTNGTRAIRLAQKAGTLYLACFLNIDAIAEAMCENARDAVVVCAGREGNFSLEDAVCAGMLIFRMECRHKEFFFNDAAHAAMALYKEWSLKLKTLLSQTDHGRYLASIGLAEDLWTCAQVNRHAIVPIFSRGRIVSQK